MPEFATPAWLWLLFAVPPLIWWWVRRQRAALRYPDTGWLAGLPGGRGRWVRGMGAGMRAAGLGLLVLALAGPRWPDRRTRIPTEGIAISMLFDVSGSMAEPDFDWQDEPISRLDAVKKVFRLFVEGGVGPDGQRLEGRASDQIALVTFATRPDRPYPLTLSHSYSFACSMESAPRACPARWNNISDALAEGWSDGSAGPSRRSDDLLVTVNTRVADAIGLTPASRAGCRQPGRGVHDRRGRFRRGSQRDRYRRHAKRAEDAATLPTYARRSFHAKDTRTFSASARDRPSGTAGDPEFQYRRYYEAYSWFGLGFACLC